MNLNADGFLGTSATVLSDISLLLGIFVGVLLTIGAVLAVLKKYEVHRWVQTTGVSINILQVLLIMIGSFIDTAAPGVPDNLNLAYYSVVSVHALIGISAFSFGTFVMLRGNNLVPHFMRFNNYKPYMRTAYGLYMLATLFGILTYHTWFIANSGTVEIAEVEVEEGEFSVPVANFLFNPTDIVIPVGTTVIWTNFDAAPHTVTADDFATFRSDTMLVNDVFTVTFDEVGEIPYFCEFHGSAGGFGMAGTIRVVPEGEAPELVSAGVPSDIALTPQPTPLPLPVEYFGQAPGTAAFRDVNGRSDQLLINAAIREPLPDGDGLFAFLISPDEAETLALGEMALAGEVSAILDYVSPTGDNLAGRYNRLVIAQAVSGSNPPEPGDNIVLEGIVPLEAHEALVELLATGADLPIINADIGAAGISAASSPGERGYAVGLRLQIDEMRRHMDHVVFNHEAGNSEGTQRHAEHIYNIIVGSEFETFGDVNGDGRAQNPGDGFGLLPNGDQLGYIEETIRAAQAAIDAPDTIPAVVAHAGHTLVSARNMAQWASEARGISFEIARGDPANITSVQIERLDTLIDWLLFGNDTNNDGFIAPIPGEGGSIAAYEHAQFAAGFGLAAPGEISNVLRNEPIATPDVLPPGATPEVTPEVVAPAETPEVASTPEVTPEVSAPAEPTSQE
ncbi:MAG: hypothetical protein D6737_14590 [Chloroflexi bacterium]|nr:MAG: hypothetical protein D6737_14590 [Chloroflexota bacterium]